MFVDFGGDFFISDVCGVYSVKCLSINILLGNILLIILLLGIGSPLSKVASDESQSSVHAANNQAKLEIPLVNIANVAAHPLIVGEKLTYNIKVSWVPVSAGRRVDHIEKKMVFDRKSVYHITSEAKTSSVAARIYRFQNRQSTFLNTEGLHPISFRNQLQDKKYTARVEIKFKDGKAEYEKISQNKPTEPEKREKKILEIPFGTQDELSMIYFLRSKKLEPGKTYFFPLISKAKVVKITVSVARGEVLKVKGLGRVKTLVVTTSHGYRLWLTDNRRHIPVKIEAEVKMGKMKANLEKLEFVK